MLAESNEAKLSLSHFLPQKNQQKIPALPLEFEYFPVEVISKEFTKLNSNHPYRVHYLGPRPLNTLILHKRYSQREDKPQKEGPRQQLKEILYFKQYRINLKKIINCNFTNERLQQNNHYKSSIFYRAFEGMNPTLPLYHEFIFNSAFESGNLDCVIKVKSNEFDLFLRIDSNTRGHTAWYYFSIKNGNRLETVTLNICNLAKPNSLYEQGMRPFVFSKKAWAEKQRGWEQDSQNCKFQQSGLRYDLQYESGHAPTTYRLNFDYAFQFEDDEVFFAYCVPYTYSQLQHDIQNYQSSPFVRKDILGKSLTGVDLPVLHITNHTNQQKKKKNIVITARVHPAEANSSHMLKGYITYLLGQSKEAEELRNTTNFFIVPMLNPDGVILGNSRTSAAGKDLNRQFMNTKKQLYPEVLHIKNFTAKIHRKYGVFMYIDFHGHSRRKNTFLYGPNYPMSNSSYYKCRIFPKLIEKFDAKFRFYSCSFAISEDKKTTARAIMLNQLKIQYVYTIQSSIGLFYNPAIMKTMPFTKQHWEEMGNSICCGINSFIQAYREYQSWMNERKFQRLKQKEQKEQKYLSTKGGNKFKEDEIQFAGKIKKNAVFLQLVEEVKVASDQVKCFQEDAESDDHDDNEELEGYKLNEFNNMVTKGVQRHKHHNKIIKEQQIDFENFVFPSIQLQQQEEDEMFESKPSPQQVSPPKGSLQTLKYPRTEDLRRREKINTQVGSANRLQQSQVKKVNLCGHKSHTIENREKLSNKNFILKNKERYSIATKNLFPIQDKCQILSLPKNIQVMRKSMKKGRLLINNLEESRLKFQNIGRFQEKQEHMVKRQGKTPFLQMDRLGNISKSSLVGGINLVADNINLNDFRIRKSQSHFHEIDYITLSGLEVDNRAMTITTFKQLK